MAELRINTTGKLSLFDADDSHAASIVAGTVTANENVMSLATAGVTFNVPTITLGDATAEDTMLVFDGNAVDYRMGLDDSADTLEIGIGSTHATTAQISLNATGFVFNEQSSDYDFRVESNSNTHMLFVDGGNNLVGIGTAPDLGVGLHIKTADSGASVAANYDELVLENSGHCGMTILSGTSSAGAVRFGDSGDNDIGGVIRQLMSSMFLRDKRIPLWSIKNSKIFTKQGSQRYVNEMEKMYINDLAKMADENSLYACYQHLYNSFHWQGATVSSLCFSADKYGFEMNLPFYDSRIHSFLSKMPENWGRGLDLSPPKYPLKWTLQNRLDYPIHLQKGPHSYLYDIDPNFSHAGEFIYSSSFLIHF